MTDNESKFNLGENSDGYTRSVPQEKPDYSYDTFTQRTGRPKQQGNAPRSGSAPKRPPQKGEPKKGQQQQQQRKRMVSPLPQAPSVRQKTLNQRYTPQQTQRKRRPAVQPQPQPSGATKSEMNRTHSRKRRQQTKVKRWISYVFIALAVIFVLIALSLTVLFPINEIAVVGSGHYPNDQIIAASGIKMGENVIRCKVDKVSERLAKSLPYVDYAEVKRSISGKVVITVTETTGKFAILHGEQCVILDETGKVLEIVSGEKAAYYAVVLKATISDPTPGTTAVLGGPVSLEKLLSLGDSLSAAAINKVTLIDMTDMSNVVVTYDGRLKLQLGTLSGLERKLALAQRVIARENELNPTQYGTINLTVEGKAYFSETKPEKKDAAAQPGDENLVG